MAIPEPLDELLQPYSPDVRRAFAVARDCVRAEAPEAAELAYDGYNAVAVAYSFTGKLRDAFCHVAVYARHVNLGFNRGVELDDPKALLQGSGKAIRHVRVQETIGDDVRVLVAQAAARAPRGSQPASHRIDAKPPSPRRRR